VTTTQELLTTLHGKPIGEVPDGALEGTLALLMAYARGGMGLPPQLSLGTPREILKDMNSANTDAIVEIAKEMGRREGAAEGVKPSARRKKYQVEIEYSHGPNMGTGHGYTEEYDTPEEAAQAGMLHASHVKSFLPRGGSMNPPKLVAFDVDEKGRRIY
jgi:hypothetical protein